MDVFQYLPNLRYAANVQFRIPLSIHNSDRHKEQRMTGSNVATVSYGAGRTFYNYESSRKYSATHTALGDLSDSILTGRINALRGDSILFPFFIEPLEANIDLVGQTAFQLNNNEYPYSELKFVSTQMVRLDRSNRDFYEFRTISTTFSDILGTGALTATAPWTASIDPNNCVLFFLDVVYPEGVLVVGEDSSKVHNLQLSFASV